MAIIAVYSPKGGVGKTTLATDLAYRCARFGKKKTLLWDFDTEGGSGFLLGADHAQNLRSSRVLEKPSAIRNHVQPTNFARLSYLGLLSDMNTFSSNLKRLGPSKRLPEVLAHAQRSYDRLILDCPPVRDELSRQVMASADLLLLPLPVSPLAARALHHVRSDLAQIERTNLPILPIFSLFDSRRKAHQTAREDWMKVFPTIPYSADIEQMAFRRMPIHEFAPRSAGSEALNVLWRGMEKRLKDDHRMKGDAPKFMTAQKSSIRKRSLLDLLPTPEGRSN